MSELSREEFIINNFGRVHRLDIRATIGKLTMPTTLGSKSPSFRPIDVFDTWGGAGLEEHSALYHVRSELDKMAELGMVNVVKKVPPASHDGGCHYERTESEPSAIAGWKLVKIGALMVARLYPDAPQNEVWQDLIADLRQGTT